CLRVAHAASLTLAAMLFAEIPALSADDDLLVRAHAAYYRAKERGLVDFRCDLRPNWELMLRAVTDPEEKKAGRAALKQLHLTLHAGPGLKTEVGHSDVATGSAQ